MELLVLLVILFLYCATGERNTCPRCGQSHNCATLHCEKCNQEMSR
jgi:hypothetical protein